MLLDVTSIRNYMDRMIAVIRPMEAGTWDPLKAFRLVKIPFGTSFVIPILDLTLDCLIIAP